MIAFIPHVVNFLICSAIIFGCLCRLKSDICTFDKLVRSKYVLLIGGAVSSGLEPVLFSPNSDIGNILLGLAILMALVIDATRWYLKGKCNDTCFM